MPLAAISILIATNLLGFKTLNKPLTMLPKTSIIFNCYIKT